MLYLKNVCLQKFLLCAFLPILSILIACSNLSYGQTAISGTQWSGFVGTSVTGPSTFATLPAATAPGSSAVNVSQWFRDIGLLANAGTGYYNSNTWSTVTGGSIPSAAITGGNDVYFTVTNNSTTELQITQLYVMSQISSTGPRNVAVEYQIGSGALTAFGSVVATAHSATAENWTFTGTCNLCAGQTATFYLYGWGATSTSGTLRINNGTSLTADYATAVTIGASSSSSPVTAGGTLSLYGGAVTPGVSPYTYSWTGPLSYSSAIQNPTISSITTGAAGTYTYTVTDAYSCTASNTTSVTVLACSGTPSTGTATPATTSFCGSGTTTVSLTGGSTGAGYTYQWYSASSFGGPYTAISGATSSSYTTPTLTATTYYEVVTTCTASSLTATSAVGTVTINPLPDAGTVSGTATVCVGSTSTLSDGSTGGSWSSSATSIATIGSTTGVVTGIAAGTATITYTVTNSCGTATATYPVTVTALPVAGTITGTLTLCEFSVTTLNDAVTGGTWSSGSTSVATVDGTGHVSGVATGTSTISYSVTSSCGTDVATAMVTVNPAPNAGIMNGVTPLCVGATATYTDTASGGTWSSASTTVATVGTTGIVTGAGAGATIISYSVTNSCGTAVATLPVSISPLPSAGTISGTDSLCLGSSTTLTSGVSGGTWISGSTTIATVGSSTGIVTGDATGNTLISYTVTNSCGSATATHTVTVFPLPSAGTISGTTNVCVGATITLTDAVSGGTWSSSATGIASVAGSGDVTGVSTGTAEISYTVTNSCGTAVSSINVTVNPLPAAGAISGLDSVCQGSSITLSETISGGIWSSSITTVATVGTTGIVSGLSMGTTLISYAFTNSCGTAYATQPLTVQPLPIAGTITGSSTLCPGVTYTLSDGIAGGTWSSAAMGIAVVDPFGALIGSSIGTTTISYTVTNSCGSASATYPVTVYALPDTGVITGSASVCVGSNTTLSDTAAGGDWSSSASSIASVTSSGIVTSAAAGTAVITYSVTNICNTLYTTKVVTIYSFPTAGTVSGTTTLCVGSSATLSESATGGTWSMVFPSIASVTTSGVVSGLMTGIDTVHYTVSNICGSAFAAALITIDSLPTAGTISGSLNVCPGSTITLTDSYTGGIWTSGATSIATVNATGVVDGIVSGVASISYTVSNLCGASTTTALVTVNALPTVSLISGANVVCIGSTISLSDSVAGGTWSSSSTAIATAYSMGTVYGAIAGVATISYTVTNSCGSITATHVITVNTTPIASAISGTAIFCTGASATLSDTATGGTWSSSNTAIATIGSSGIVNGIASGLDTISYSLSNTCGTSIVTTAIAVEPLPFSGTITGADSFCYITYNALSDSMSGGVWSSSATSIATVNPSGIVAGIAPGTVIISYSVTNSCGTSVSTKNLTLDAVPSAGGITGTTNFCVFTSSTLSDPIAGGFWSSSIPGVAMPDSVGIVAGLEPGIANITYSVSNSCGTATAVATVTIDPLPSTGAVLVSSPTVCIGSVIAAVDTMAGGTWSTSDTTIATINTMGLITGVSTGVVNISYSLTNSCGTSSSIQPVTVNTVPSPGPISGPSNICTSGTGTLSNSVTGGAWTSGNPSLATINSVTGVVSGVSPGVDTIFYTATNACGSTVVSTIITVNLVPVAGVIYGDSVLCASSVVVLTDLVGGGTWSSSAPSVAVVDMAGIVTGISGGTASISFSVSSSCGTAMAVKHITVNPLPQSGTIVGSGLVCLGSVSPFTDTAVGGTWISSDTSIIQINSAGLSAGVSLGSAVISYSFTNSCGTSVTTFAVTVGSIPSVTSITGSSNVCQSSFVILVDSSTGGSWGSSNPSIASVSSSGLVTGVFPGVVIISYSLTNSCGTVSSTKTVTVNAAPNAGVIAGPTNVCVSSEVTLADSVGGGTWSSSNTAVAYVDSLTGIVIGTSIGSATMTYSVTNGCGSAFAVFSEIVSLSPVVGSVMGGSQVCVGATSALGDSISGGTWSSGNTLIATVGSSTGFVSGVNAGSTTITYTVSNSCGSVFSTKSVTVNPDPPAITGPSFVCIGLSTSLSDSLSGGIWTSSNISNATVDTFTGVVHGVSPGSAIITYRMPSGCYSSVSVAIDPLPYAGTIAGSGSLCVGSSSLLIDMVSGGIWSASNGNASISGGTVVGVTAGVDTIHYTVTNTCGSGTASKTVTVNDAPVAGAIAGVSSICSGQTITLTESVPGGLWNVTNSHAAISPVGLMTGLSAGIDTVLYSISNLCGVTTALKIVTINPIPATISGATFICQGNVSTLSDAVGGGTWTSSSPATASIDSVTGVLIGINYGNVTVTYSESLTCFATTIVTINPLPPAISGPNQVCAGAYISLIDSVSGSWTTTNSAGTIDLLSGVVTGNYPGVDTVLFSMATGCSSMMTITVNAIPSSISGVSAVCINSNITLSDATATGGWNSIGTDATVDVVTGVVTGVTAGIDTIMYTLPDGCSVSLVLTVNPLPSAIVGLYTVCQAANITLTDTTAGGTWSISNANASVDPALGIVTGYSVGADTVSYTLATGCAYTSIITVNPLPFAGGVVGQDTVCLGTVALFTDTVLSGVWSMSNGAASVTGGSVVTNYAGWDTISYAVTNMCGTQSATKPIYIMPLPNAGSITGSGNICLGTANTLTEAVSGGTWSSQNPLIATVSSTGLLTGVSLGIDSVYYTISNLCGNSIATIYVTVDTFPVTSILGRTYACVGKYDTLIGNPYGGVWSSTDTNVVVTGNVIAGHSVGIDTIVYSVTNFCGSSTSKFAIRVPTKHECDSIDYVADINVALMGTLELYPNPNSGRFTMKINSESNSIFNVIINNAIGQKVDEMTIPSNKEKEFELKCPAGIYVITVSDGKQIWKTKITVIK